MTTWAAPPGGVEPPPEPTVVNKDGTSTGLSLGQYVEKMSDAGKEALTGTTTETPAPPAPEPEAPAAPDTGAEEKGGEAPAQDRETESPPTPSEPEETVQIAPSGFPKPDFDTGRLKDPEYVAQWEREHPGKNLLVENNRYWSDVHRIKSEQTKKAHETLTKQVEERYGDLDPAKAREALETLEWLEQHPDYPTIAALTNPRHPHHELVKGRLANAVETAPQDEAMSLLESAVNEDGVIDPAKFQKLLAERDAQRQAPESNGRDGTEPTGAPTQEPTPEQKARAEEGAALWRSYAKINGIDAAEEVEFARILRTRTAEDPARARLPMLERLEDARQVRATELQTEMERLRTEEVEESRSRGSIPRPTGPASPTPEKRLDPSTMTLGSFAEARARGEA